MIEANVTGTEAVIAHLDSLGDNVRAALRAAITAQAFDLQGKTVTGKLSGNPLKRRTGNLASSINVEITEDSSSITGRVGTNVAYAAVHEYGGTFEIPAHSRRVTEVFGHEVAAHDIEVRAHSATYPERSFLRSTLRDNADQLREAIAQAVADATKEGG